MSPLVRAEIKPELLRWARETAGMTVEVAARKLGVKPARLTDWETDRLRPTVGQLRKAANVYKRPFAVFFLPAPPAQPEPLHDFRRLPDEQLPPPSPALLLEMRRARRRRMVALELLADLDLQVPRFPLRDSLEDDPDLVAARGREWLGITIDQQARWVGPYDALNGWIAAFEARGALVFQTGAVGVDEMRGFSISDQRLPVIVLNAKDAPRGRVFTLMHEFTHVVLNRSGLCDPERVQRSRWRTPDEQVEVFCNYVAGALLVPADALLTDPRVVTAPRPREWDDETISALAEHFAVSREVILRRFLILGATTEEFYERKRAEYLEQYRAQAERVREAGGFPPIFRVTLRDNGRRYTQLVLDALERERITFADVSDYLGVRVKHLDNIAVALERSGVKA